MARRDAEAIVFEYIDKILPGGENKKLYEDRFKEMSDKEFKVMIEDLANGKFILPIIAPNGHVNSLSTERNFKLAKSMGVTFFQRLKVGEQDGLPAHITNNEYLMFDLPIRRTAQLLTKGVAVSEHNRQRDQLTGAVSGDSKSTTMTYPEIQVLFGIGLDKSVKELMTIRGGDIGANRALEAMLERYGKVTFASIAPYKTGVTGIQTLKHFFAAAHIKAVI